MSLRVSAEARFCCFLFYAKRFEDSVLRTLIEDKIEASNQFWGDSTKVCGWSMICFDVPFCHAALLLLVYDYPRFVPVGAFAFDFASFSKARVLNRRARSG